MTRIALKELPKANWKMKSLLYKLTMSNNYTIMIIIYFEIMGKTILKFMVAV